MRVGRAVASLTHLDKPFWPQEGYTKSDLLAFYYAAAPSLLPYLRDRPLILKRYPNGIRGKFFFQHELANAPPFVRTAQLEAATSQPPGSSRASELRCIDYAVCNNLAALLYLANLGAIEQHPWHSRLAHLDRPDWIVFDLDPAGVAYDRVCEVALSLRRLLARDGLRGCAKTSGSRGMHVYVPLQPRYSYEQVARYAENLAAGLAAANPSTATTVRSLQRRAARRIYVDALQNARGKSVAAPYSVRARPGAPVSTPLTWDEVEAGRLTPADFTILNVPARLRQRGDLFEAVLKDRQKLPARSA